MKSKRSKKSKGGASPVGRRTLRYRDLRVRQTMHPPIFCQPKVEVSPYSRPE